MPDEMGELFKVLTLGKGIEPTEMGGLLGYQFMDLRQQL
jgi:SAM-dependent MidA family methyltransferase